MAIRRVLIANRGEIAVRIISTCRALGIETVLAASVIDMGGLAAGLADRAVCIGPAHATSSYLNVETIVQAALGARCDALHPGYGFLSENPRLAAACEANGIVFLGPTADQIAAVGDKLSARRLAERAGVAVAPGGSIADAAEAEEIAAAIGYPLLVKAVAGGGGRGMKRVNSAAELGDAVDLAMAEAAAAFGDSRVYLERFVASGRHIEVQIIGDGETVLHLGERDCSVQRRYQKVVEEAPAPALSDGTRAAICTAAVQFCRALNYRSLGTVEFLFDRERGAFYFLEMNARIQVEHPVTEAVTGLDLVAEQIHIGEGGKLRFRQSEVAARGHAVECRINAEAPAQDFRPCPGRVGLAFFPNRHDIRVDTYLTSGAEVAPFYDSMIAKIIAFGPDRASALASMRRALRTTRIDGVDTNIALHQALLSDPQFIAGGVDTNFLTDFLARGSHHGQH
jgi:acetyl-CoA carboxylase biotin carboxylase subunit